jgi:hypothetical protein
LAQVAQLSHFLTLGLDLAVQILLFLTFYRTEEVVEDLMVEGLLYLEQVVEEEVA